MEVCLDLSLPLSTRLESITLLTEPESDDLIERLCSVYNIHPTFTCLEYIRAIILHPKICINRRVRIAETCDLGRSVLYLVNRLPASQAISCIEMFSNQYLKHHAYEVLYSKCRELESKVQIVKNMFRLQHLKKIHKVFFDWFKGIVLDDSIEYKIRANCADFIIINASPKSLYTTIANRFLKLDDNINIYEHKENVHLFTPKPEVVKHLITRGTKVSMDEIFTFALEHDFDTELLIQRIVNDKTILNMCTLSELLCAVWSELTDDLRVLLLGDIRDSVNDWMCTTGYYNRIINIYQSVHKDSCLLEIGKLDEHNFTQDLIRSINKYIYTDNNKEDIILELPNASEEFRIKYLTFRIHTLPNVLDELRSRHSHLSPETFDEYFSRALRIYESF